MYTHVLKKLTLVIQAAVILKHGELANDNGTTQNLTKLRHVDFKSEVCFRNFETLSFSLIPNTQIFGAVHA